MNKLFITGNVGREPEVNETYTTFPVATNKKWKNKQGEDQEKTEWHRVVVFGNLQKVCGYIEKGKKVTVVGEVNYQIEEKKLKGVSVIAQDIELL